MFVRKNLPGGASGGYTWDKPGAVLEIPDWLGEELLAIPNGGFTEVFPEPDPEPEPEETAPDQDSDEAQEGDSAEETLTRAQKAAATRAANKAAAQAAE